MEDDAVLSENVTSIAAMDVVSRSLAEIDQRRAKSPTPLQHGFAYFGMCRGDCTVNIRLLTPDYTIYVDVGINTIESNRAILFWLLQI